MSGFYLMRRGWLDSPELGGTREPYCRRAAWAWLIEHAAFTDHEIRVGGKPQHIARGQLSTSLRILGRQWGWTEPKVRRFLRVLVECSKIDAAGDAHHTLITLCDYEQNQEGSWSGDALPDAAATQQRRTNDAPKDNKQGNQGKEGEEPPPIVPPQKSRRASAGQKKGRLPPDWQPDLSDREHAASRGWDGATIAEQAEVFRDHHIAKGTHSEDWAASWRTWVYNAKRFAPRHHGGPAFAGRSAQEPGPILAAIGAIRARRSVG